MPQFGIDIDNSSGTCISRKTELKTNIGEQHMVPARKFNGLSSLPDFFNDFFDNGGIERISTKAPAINVIEEEDKYKIEIATPGMTKDDFQIHVNKDGNLVIEMERKKEEEEKKDKKYIRKEFAYTRFHQTLILPENADKEKINAKVENGVLKVCIPKLQNEVTEPEKRVIEVK